MRTRTTHILSERELKEWMDGMKLYLPRTLHFKLKALKRSHEELRADRDALAEVDEELMTLENHGRLKGFEHLRALVWKLHPELEAKARALAVHGSGEEPGA